MGKVSVELPDIGLLGFGEMKLMSLALSLPVPFAELPRAQYQMHNSTNAQDRNGARTAAIVGMGVERGRSVNIYNANLIRVSATLHC